MLHGSQSFLLQDEEGQGLEAHSISAGLDYPGSGPEHAYYKEKGRFQYESVTDAEALDVSEYLSTLRSPPAFESIALPRTDPKTLDDIALYFEMATKTIFDAKADLARSITAQFHGQAEAGRAEEDHHFGDEADPYANRHASSLRAIYDLADPQASLFIHPGGQSGNPLSAHYRSFAPLWARGDYVPMITDRARLEAGGVQRLLLKPRP